MFFSPCRWNPRNCSLEEHVPLEHCVFSCHQCLMTYDAQQLLYIRFNWPAMWDLHCKIHHLYILPHGLSILFGLFTLGIVSKNMEIYHPGLQTILKVWKTWSTSTISGYPKRTSPLLMANHLVGGLEHFLFCHILGIIISIDQYYFSEGLKPPTSHGLNQLKAFILFVNPDWFCASHFSWLILTG